MTGSEAGTFNIYVAIFAMAAAVILMRFGGFWLMAHVPLTARLQRMLEALPGCVMMATAIPIAVKNGPAGMLAVAVALAAMIAIRNDFLAVMVALGVAAGVRAAGF